ncbi:MAG: laminin G, partial [Calditrichia bacterium]|nr:laminin G [Calditrichia bacterium]
MINITCGLSGVFSQQIDINLVEMMPNMPSPYEMRDWKQVALGYDSLVFDFTQTGEYLPLIWWNPDPVNYPEHPSFGLETYVGTIFLHAGEAINIIPAVIGASLVGVNKSEQNGQNWALMCEEFFNRRPEENIYLNRFVSCSGNDWWYDTMPNIFFYQLNYLYPNTGDFSWQFTTIADQWLRAVKAMGGNAAPWNVPYMNYRGWSFSTMSPGSEEYPEPEAAGAIAWLLYNAYAETGQEEYRIGAEWALEFLNGWPQNPSYELQMPYGAYAAARMNAELGTNYDIEKMVNWCFDRGEIRGWGAIIGNWGGYDVSGLIGELSDNDYAFLMNGFEQVGALVPMVRYDDRFARAVGKWVLNVANASRLFYANYLPPGNQDSENWAYQYDTQSYIGYEAIRENLYAITPYATGDAISGGWANTNLALYGSSHVGIMGGIIDTTNVSMILKLDMLKADYYRDEAYPTYLYFNPYSEDQIVEIDVGGGMYDLYNAVSNSFLATSISGVSSIIIPADQAVQLVIIPSGGIVTYDLERMLVNNIVVDYRSGQQVSNYPPRIKSLAADSITVNTGNSTTLYCTAEDKDNDLL